MDPMTQQPNVRSLWAVVPIKRLAAAKQRLAPLLGGAREEFALLLARRTLEVLRESDLFQGIIVVSPDPRVAAEAAAFGALAIDDADATLNAACLLGLAAATARGAAVCVLMPSDLAALTPESLADIVECYRALRDRRGREVLGLLRCKDGTGTNMVLLDPGCQFEPAFGADSFARHMEASPARAHELIAPAVGGVQTSDGRPVPADQKIDGAPSVLYDAVVVLSAKQGTPLLAALPAARDFVADAYAHCKFIGYTGDATPLFDAAGLTPLMDDGFADLDRLSAADFMSRCAELRFWPRQVGVAEKVAGARANP